MGYITPDTTVDMMFDHAVADEWERNNIPAIDADILRKAAGSLSIAVVQMDTAAENVKRAMDVLADTVAEDRVGAMLNDMENLLCDLRAMKNKYERGER